MQATTILQQQQPAQQQVPYQPESQVVVNGQTQLDEELLKIVQKARESTLGQDQQFVPEPLPQQQQQQQQQEQQQYQCSVCGMQTPQINSIMSHMKKQHGVTTRIKCPLCNNTYSDQHGLKRHFKKAHAAEAAAGNGNQALAYPSFM